jgi:hypothetical protein
MVDERDGQLTSMVAIDAYFDHRGAYFEHKMDECREETARSAESASLRELSPNIVA